MKQAEAVFVCSNCGNEFVKWSGQCSACKEWNSLKESKSLKVESRRGGWERRAKVEVVNLGSAKQKQEFNDAYLSTQIREFDRVLGKGIVRGQVILFAGEPGIGKSTLITQVIGKIGGLYVAGEESAEQVNIRVRRLGLAIQGFDVLETNDIESIIEVVERTKNLYKIAVVDSIQVMSPAFAEASAGKAGSVSDVRQATFQLVELAKRTGVAIIIVGHVTKEGDIAGPKLLEHMVDTVLYFEGDRNSELRVLRVTKNRFGPTDEVGIFKMTERGLEEVRGEEINLVENGKEKVGSAITVVVEGSRPMMVEIQALVTECFGPMPKRVFSGIDYNRGQLLVAVAQKVLGMPLYKYDVYVAVTGGIRIEDTGADLAVVAAMWSSFRNKPLGPAYAKPTSQSYDGRGATAGKGGVVLMGEVSLLGEVKRVKFWEKRVKEAEALGREVVGIGDVRELKGMA